MPRILDALVTASVALLVGCSSAASPPAGSASCRADGASYPTSGCGYEVGLVVPDFAFEGRLEGLGSPRTTVHLADLYDPARSKGLRYLLVNATALWCPYCAEETRALPQMKVDYGPRGVRFMTLLLEDKSGAIATLDDVDGFIRNNALETIVVTDPEQVTTLFFDKTSMPLNMIVDLRTMKIVRKIVGGSWASVRTSLDLALQGG